MAAVQRGQPAATSTTTASSSKLDANLAIRLRPKAVLINAADFSYGYDDIECTGERYLTPCNVSNSEKPFFDDFVAAKTGTSPRRDTVTVREIPVSPSPPGSLVSSPRTEQPPTRAVVRWKDVPDHKGNEDHPKETQSQKPSSTGPSQSDRKHDGAPKMPKSILKPTNYVPPPREISQGQPQSRSTATQQPSRQPTKAPRLARISESPHEETPAHSLQRLTRVPESPCKESRVQSPTSHPGYPYPAYPPQQQQQQPPPQYQYQQYQQPHLYYTPSAPPAYPQYHPQSYPGKVPPAYPPQYTSQPSGQRPAVASYTNRYRPTRDGHAEYQHRPIAHEKQTARRASMSAPYQPHLEVDERRGSY